MLNPFRLVRVFTSSDFELFIENHGFATDYD